MDDQGLTHPDDALARCQPIFDNCESFRGFKCPVDAKNGASVSHEQQESQELELPVSLSEALLHLVYEQHETNQLLAQIVQQNQRMLAVVLDEPDEAEPRTDMEGKPIRDS
jgi:hypothetical protein